MDKGEIVLIVLAVIVMVGIFIAWPYTDMGKSIYEANRQNAINYIMNAWGSYDPLEREQAERLMDKYNLDEYFRGPRFETD
jgi:hypothetical protein